MQPLIQQLIEEIKSKKVFRRNRKRIELKILSALLYFYGLSLRKASKFISLFEQISRISQNLLPQAKESIKTSRKGEKKVNCNRRNETKTGKQTTLSGVR